MKFQKADALFADEEVRRGGRSSTSRSSTAIRTARTPTRRSTTPPSPTRTSSATRRRRSCTSASSTSTRRRSSSTTRSSARRSATRRRSSSTARRCRTCGWPRTSASPHRRIAPTRSTTPPSSSRTIRTTPRRPTSSSVRGGEDDQARGRVGGVLPPGREPREDEGLTTRPSRPSTSTSRPTATIPRAGARARGVVPHARRTDEAKHDKAAADAHRTRRSWPQGARRRRRRSRRSSRRTRRSSSPSRSCRRSRRPRSRAAARQLAASIQSSRPTSAGPGRRVQQGHRVPPGDLDAGRLLPHRLPLRAFSKALLGGAVPAGGQAAGCGSLRHVSRSDRTDGGGR